MIATTVNFPAPDSRSVLVIVIEKENLERMRKADPITLESKNQGGKVLTQIQYPENQSILIAYEENDVELYRIAKTGNALLMLAYLERGRTWVEGVDGLVSTLTKKEGSDAGGK